MKIEELKSNIGVWSDLFVKAESVLRKIEEKRNKIFFRVLKDILHKFCPNNDSIKRKCGIKQSEEMKEFFYFQNERKKSNEFKLIFTTYS